jgi:orotidine-5'-phosphate decarboxylase
MGKLITQRRSVIPACDVASLEKLKQIVEATTGLSGIGGYKVGLELVIPFGLKRVVETIREQSQLPVIYDHQKGGTDIPELGLKFARAVKSSGVEAVILFPFGGAATEIEWIKACQGEGLVVLVGGHMTQPKFLDIEGGFISSDGPKRIYELAAQNNTTDFVVPGNKTDFVLQYRQVIKEVLGEGNFVLYAPGFITQGGNISETGQVAGEDWHAIVGSAVYKKEGVEAMRQAALEATSQIVWG